MIAVVLADYLHAKARYIISQRPWCLGALLCDDALTMMEMELISSWGRGIPAPPTGLLCINVPS